MGLPGTTIQTTSYKKPIAIDKSKKTSGKNLLFEDSTSNKAEVLVSLLTRQIGAAPVEFISKHIDLTGGTTFLTKTSIKFN
ncbi:MAG TPA: hypothetical protein VIN10_10840, partial [Bacteroidales bacterium]